MMISFFLHSFISVFIYLFWLGCCLFRQQTTQQLTRFWNIALIALKSLNLSNFFGKCFIQRLTTYISDNYPGINSIGWQVNQFIETFIHVIYSQRFIQVQMKVEMVFNCVKEHLNLSFVSTVEKKFINMDSSTFLLKKKKKSAFV